MSLLSFFKQLPSKDTTKALAEPTPDVVSASVAAPLAPSEAVASADDVLVTDKRPRADSAGTTTPLSQKRARPNPSKPTSPPTTCSEPVAVPAASIFSPAKVVQKDEDETKRTFPPTALVLKTPELMHSTKVRGAWGVRRGTWDVGRGT